MLRLIKVPFSFFLAVSFAVHIMAADKRKVQIEQIDSLGAMTRNELRVRTEPYDAEPCHVIPTNDLVWLVEGWVTGSELYKNYIDPELSCENPYPFSITEINMPMYFSGPTAIWVSVDVEDVYYSAPECPWPDSVLAISTDYQINVASEGLYDIWIPLNEPVVVNGPFFIGFFIGNSVDSSVGIALLADSNASARCQSYNIWDEHVGFVDLLNNPLWNFPGQLVLYASGIPGGGDRPAEPDPEVKILSPRDGDQLLCRTSVWAYETSGSSAIDYVSFEYLSAGRFVEIGRDYEGTRSMRNGVHDCGTGNGYGYEWNLSSLVEGNFTLRVTAFDTLGRSASDQISVYLEPTPPTPGIIAPSSTSDICVPAEIVISCPDENVARVSFYHKSASNEYSAGLRPLYQFDYGDDNDNRNDGNRVAEGEFGDYYCGPVAAAMAINLWANRGYSSLSDFEPDDTAATSLVEHLADRFHVRENSGTVDEFLLQGLLDYSAGKGDNLLIESYRNPDYTLLRVVAEEEERAVMLAVGGNPGSWLTVDGFSGWRRDDGSYLIAAGNPVSGRIEMLPLRDKPDGSELRLGGDWHPVDLLVSLEAANWNVDRSFIGADEEDSDGWSYTWTASSLPPDSRHFIRAEAVDGMGIKHHCTVILNHDCSGVFTVGDYDGDGTASLADLVYLVQFISNQGPEPVGGAWRGDTNGDSHLNITDLVYYGNYLYGMTGPPRY